MEEDKSMLYSLSQGGKLVAEVSIKESNNSVEVRTDIMPGAYSRLLLDTPEQDKVIISTFSMLSEMDTWLQEVFNADMVYGSDNFIVVLREVEHLMRMMAGEFGLEYLKTFPECETIKIEPNEY